MYVWMSSLNDGEEAFIKSRVHVRDREGDSINLRVQAYSCHPVRGGRGEGGRDTDSKAFSLNNGCPVFWKKAKSSQFSPQRPFLSLVPSRERFLTECPLRLFPLSAFFPYSQLLPCTQHHHKHAIYLSCCFFLTVANLLMGIQHFFCQRVV